MHFKTLRNVIRIGHQVNRDVKAIFGLNIEYFIEITNMYIIFIIEIFS